MKRVGVQELDQRFSDIAETFNKQQEHYETMVRRIRNVRQIYGCNSNDTLALTECVMKIREEHGKIYSELGNETYQCFFIVNLFLFHLKAHYRVFVKLNGYDFSLSVVPLGSAGGHTEEVLPPHLKLAQDEFKDASDSAKATISKGTAIQELIGWLLRSTDQMAERVKGAAATYQEQRRLSDNLERNVKEVRRAKDLSQRYRQIATEVLSEVAHIAGTIT